MEARVIKFADPRTEDSTRQPRLTLWVAGDELSASLHAVADYCDNATTMLITLPTGQTQELTVFLVSVKFAQGKSATLDFKVELAAPLELHIGEIIQVALGV